MPENSFPKSRSRFSLLNLMFAMTIAALGLGLLASARRNADLQAINDGLARENLQHRNELGVFDVTDPAQIHAIRVPTEEGAPRKYRLYLPPGNKYTFNYAANNIPEKGVPPGHDNRSELAPGHYLVSLQLTRKTDRKTGEPVPYGRVDLDVKTTDGPPNRSQGFGIGIRESKNDWLLNKATGSTAYSWQEIGSQLQTFGAAGTVVLYLAQRTPHSFVGDAPMESLQAGVPSRLLGIATGSWFGLRPSRTKPSERNNLKPRSCLRIHRPTQGTGYSVPTVGQIPLRQKRQESHKLIGQQLHTLDHLFLAISLRP
jgi:hypothetical protein